MAELECENTGNTEVQGESIDIPTPKRAKKQQCYFKSQWILELQGIGKREVCKSVCIM